MNLIEIIFISNALERFPAKKRGEKSCKLLSTLDQNLRVNRYYARTEIY